MISFNGMLEVVTRERRDCGVLGTSKDTFTSGNVIRRERVEIESMIADLSVS